MTIEDDTPPPKPSLRLVQLPQEIEDCIQGKTTIGLDERNAGNLILPPPRQWLLGTQFCRKVLSGIIAPGSTGKSALRILQAIALASGRPLTGQHVFRRCRVLILSLEDDLQEIERRIFAACKHHKVDQSELDGWLFYSCPNGLRIAECIRGERQAGILDKLVRDAIDRRKIDLVIFDPFIKTHNFNENDNNAIDFVCERLAALAIDTNVAIDAPHHAHKGALSPGDADSGRGASAARDAGRLMYTLTAMNPEEGDSFGISSEDRMAYIRLDSAKVNLAPPARKASWFKLIGVPLENGDSDYPNGDVVQTVEPWTPPGIWEDLPNVALNAVLTEIDAGLSDGQRYTDASAARERAAWTVVERHCPGKTEVQYREIIRTWIRNGVLYREQYQDPVARKERSGLRLDVTKRPT